MIAYGTPLVDDPDRIGPVTALGIDEVLFARLGRWRTQAWSTSIVDVGAVAVGPVEAVETPAAQLGRLVEVPLG